LFLILHHQREATTNSNGYLLDGGQLDHQGLCESVNPIKFSQYQYLEIVHGMNMCNKCMIKISL